MRPKQYLLLAFLFIIAGVVGGGDISVAQQSDGAESVAPADEEPASEPTSTGGVRRRRPGADSDTGRRRVGTDTVGTAREVRKEEARAIERGEITPGGLALGPEFFPVENRWNMLYDGKWYDPYNQNILKGDLPSFGSPGHEWFIEVSAVSDTLVEPRRVPTPVSITSTAGAGRNDIFGEPDQLFVNQNFIFEFALIKGNTTFKPQDFELRVAPIINLNYVEVDETGVLRADPSRGTERGDNAFSLLKAFIDVHLANVSERYDFISSRFGVQEFNADFRGLVFREEQPGIRFFGNWDNNKYQWNLGWFHRLRKDANSLLPVLFESRYEDVFAFNVYSQDLIALGHTVEFVALYRDDRFGDEGPNIDENGFLTSPPSIGTERPKNLRTTYLGLNSDGHFDRVNVSSALYWAFGSESHNPIAGEGTDVNAFLAALELSYDIDWLRPRVSFLWASGDDDPLDGDAEGFDAIFDNPNFVGGEFSYWVRQGIPLIGGGGVALTNRLSPLADLRPGKDQGQSNFVNPGILILNAGLDIDLTPKVVLVNNLNWLQFDDTAVLETVRQDGSISRDIGLDLATGVIYRPFLNNNVQFRAGLGVLFPGNGLKNLYGDDTLYHAFGNMVLLY